MDKTERRRFDRIKAKIPVEIRVGSVVDSCHTVEIAADGVFVATPDLRPVHQLLAVRVRLPTGQKLDLHGMVARSEKGDKQNPGMAIRFYGLRPEAQKEWEDFVDEAQEVDKKNRRREAKHLAAESGLDPKMVAAALSRKDRQRVSSPEPEPGQKPPRKKGSRSTSRHSMDSLGLTTGEEAGRPQATPIFIIGEGSSPKATSAPKGPEAPEKVAQGVSAEEPRCQAARELHTKDTDQHNASSKEPLTKDTDQHDAPSEELLTKDTDQHDALSEELLSHGTGQQEISDGALPKDTEEHNRPDVEALLSGEEEASEPDSAETADDASMEISGDPPAGEDASEPPSAETATEVPSSEGLSGEGSSTESARQGAPPFRDTSRVVLPPAPSPWDEESLEVRPPFPKEEAGAETDIGTAATVAIVPASRQGAPLAPTADSSSGHVVYRIELPSIEALSGFAANALASGGVWVRTADFRPPGTPAIVCVVHPISRDEFHLPGRVVPSRPGSAGVAVGFSAITGKTHALFHQFIALGIPDDDAPSQIVQDDLAVIRRSDPVGEDNEPPRDTMEVDMGDVGPLDGTSV